VTKRHIEVLMLKALGLSSRQVGQILWLSEKTVKAHLQYLSARLDARNTTHAVTIALTRNHFTLADLQVLEEEISERLREEAS